MSYNFIVPYSATLRNRNCGRPLTAARLFLYHGPMKPVTIQEARLIARQAARQADVPRFYQENEPALALSRAVYEADEIVGRYRDSLASEIDEFGHGLTHSELVALDAGAIVAVERADDTPETRDIVAVAQTAGLLHDIRRKEPDHAEKSALAADAILRQDGMGAARRALIVGAVRNHEAFRAETPISDPTAKLISDSLYDADKFRWGPDNFAVTLWDMLEYAHVDVGRMLAGYHKSIGGIQRIRDTFRTQTGRRYGPEFIDIGLAVGEVIYRRLVELQESGS